MSTVHVVGEMDDQLRQICMRCGFFVLDNDITAWKEGRVASDGPEPPTPSHFPPGQVTVSGNFSSAGRLDGAHDCSPRDRDLVE